MTERERFEAWFMREYFDYLSIDMVKKVGLSMNESGTNYSNLEVRRMWEAWQAAKRDADDINNHSPHE